MSATSNPELVILFLLILVTGMALIIPPAVPVENTITACEWCENHYGSTTCWNCSVWDTRTFENSEDCIQEYRERLNYTKDVFPCYCGSRSLFPPSLLEWWVRGDKIEGVI